MSLLTPPTDNLYKFIAITGAALFIYGTYSLPEAEDRLERQKAEHRLLELDPSLRWKLTIPIRYVSAPYITTNAAGDEIIVGAGEEPPTKDTLEYESNMFKSNRWVAYVFVKSQTEEKLVEASVNRRLRLSKVSMGLGVAMMVGGFIAWGFLTQRYQDRILRQEASKGK